MVKEYSAVIIIALVLIKLYLIGSSPDQQSVDQPAAQQTGDIRQQIVQTALSQLGKPYVLGTRGPDTFDCSGFVQWVYKQHGIQIPDDTFSQQPALRDIRSVDLQPGDLIYEQFPTDQHVVMWMGDLDGNGTGDVINAGGYLDRGDDVNIIYDFFENNPVFTEAIIGYRSVL